MVGINPLKTNLTFGAAEVAPLSQPIVPVAITNNNPIQQSIGYLETDLYGSKHNSKEKTEEYGTEDYGAEYKQYMTKASSASQSSIGKKILVTGLVLGGVVMGIRKRTTIRNGLKDLFKDTSGIQRKNINSTKPPKGIVLEEFQSRFDKAAEGAKKGDFNNVELANFRVIFGDEEKAETKKESLKNLFKLSTIYTQKDRQARVLIIMPEHMQDKANHIVDMFSKNKIHEMNPEDLAHIEGFQLINADRHYLNEGHFIVADAQVARGINASDGGAVIDKWWDNAKAFVKGVL